MHVEVGSRSIVCCGMSPSRLVLVFDVIGGLHNCDVVILLVSMYNVEVNYLLIGNI
jgi:hypothetical protein